MTNAIVKGSISDMAKQNNKSIAESFLSCQHIVIVDTSGSMYGRDARGGKTRYDVAIEELTQLQGKLPGKIAIISFSDSVKFCPTGIPTFIGAGTNMSKALRFVRVADVPGMNFIVISDGEPDSEADAIYEAKQFQNKISTIYVGPEGDQRGRDFLVRLASVTGGKTTMAALAENLQNEILLLTA